MVLKVSEQSIRKRLLTNGFSSVTKVTHPRGGRPVWRIHLSCLPPDAQMKWLDKQREKLPEPPLPPAHAQAGPPVPLRNNGTGQVPGCLNKRELTDALAKNDLIREYKNFLARHPRGKRTYAREEFERAYNSAQLYPQLFAVLGPVSWKTLERWRSSLEKHKDCYVLADRRGRHRRGASGLTHEQAKILIGCACHPNRPNLSEAIRMARAVMAAKGVKNGHSDRTYRRFLRWWRDRNYHIWVWTREGEKAWNEKVAFCIERDITLLNVGDILVADGHTLNFEILNPWTGKPKRMTLILWYDMRSNYPAGWEIMPEENTQAIASALRRAILRLGKIPRVAYLDNGRAFGARFFHGTDLSACGLDGVFGRLGIQTIFAWPYHPQSKTVERFFKTFGELERWMPTYVGTSVERKPPRMNRGEVLHRRIFEKVMEGHHITLEQAHLAVATWFDEYAQRPQRGHLEGACPQEVFDEGRGPGVDPAELCHLMMSVEVRHIRANGVSLFGRSYYAPELYGRKEPVAVHYDLQDPSSIEIYDLEGNHLCTARHLGKVHPAARLLGTDADVEKLESHLAIKAIQRRDAQGPARAFLAKEVLPEYRRMLETQGLLPNGTGQRAQGTGQRAQGEDIEKELEELMAMQEEFRETPWLKLQKLSEPDRYEALLEMQAKGEEIPEEGVTFMRFFEQSEYYEFHAEYFEHVRRKFTLCYGGDKWDSSSSNRSLCTTTM